LEKATDEEDKSTAGIISTSRNRILNSRVEEGEQEVKEEEHEDGKEDKDGTKDTAQ
jgi:hypothetical protein